MGHHHLPWFIVTLRPQGGSNSSPHKPAGDMDVGTSMYWRPWHYWETTLTWWRHHLNSVWCCCCPGQPLFLLGHCDCSFIMLPPRSEIVMNNIFLCLHACTLAYIYCAYSQKHTNSASSSKERDKGGIKGTCLYLCTAYCYFIDNVVQCVYVDLAGGAVWGPGHWSTSGQHWISAPRRLCWHQVIHVATTSFRCVCCRITSPQ